MTTIRVYEAQSPAVELIERLVWVFRETREDRLQFLLDLHGPDEDREYFGRVIFAENRVWVAEVGEAVAGFIAFANGWLNHLYVASEFQSLGVGSKLLAIAKRLNPSLQLWVFQANLPAIRFYERRGFRVVERTDGSGNEARKPDLRMRWDIAEPAAL